MKRTATLLALASMAPFAHASYELMMVCDLTNKCIQRFDAETGAYLGSFGKGMLISPTAVAADKATGRAYVVDTSLAEIMTFDYSTGGKIADTPNFVSTNSHLLMLNTGNLALSGYGGGFVQMTPPSLAQTGVYYYASGLSTGLAQTADGTIVSLNGPGGVLYAHTPGNGTAKFSLTVSGFANGTAMAAQGNTAYTLVPSANAVYKYTVGTSAFGTAYTAASLSGVFTGSTATGMAVGHAGNMYVCGTALTGGSVISRYNAASNYTGSLSTFGNGVLGSTGGMTVVVAPEPSTWVAMSLGALVLLRRRR